MDIITSLEIITTFFAGCGLFFAGYQVKIAVKTRREEHDWNRRKAAQDIAIQFDELNPLKQKVNDYIDTRRSKGSIGLDELEEAINGDKQLESAIDTLLNYYEYLAMGIKQGVYDEKLIEDFWGKTMIKNYLRYHDYIKSIRNSNYPEVWVFLEEYAIKWKANSGNTPDRSKTGW